MLLNYLILFLSVIVGMESKLEQVVSLFRHGARYHLNGYYDGNSTKQLWGELTGVGMRQHQNFGRMLRKDYIDNLNFLTSEYTANSIEVFCTDVNRTLESVRSQLYGLYPLGFGPKLPKVSKQYYLPPFSIKNDSKQQTYALPDGYLPFPINIKDSVIMTNCQNWDKQTKKNIDSQDLVYKEMQMTYQPFLKRMGQMFNIDATSMNFSKISSLYDTLTVDKYLGRPMPANLTEDDYLNLRHLHYWHNFFYINFNLSKALNTGKLNRVIADFDDRIRNSKKQLKWTILSGHDTDISAMLQDLNMSSSKCIEQLYRNGKTDALNCDPGQQFVSNIIFELHSEENNYNIKIRHDGVYLNLCERRSTSCPYDQWRSRAKTIILNDTDAVCGKNGGSEYQVLL